jgi:hypothetical protein
VVRRLALPCFATLFAACSPAAPVPATTASAASAAPASASAPAIDEPEDCAAKPAAKAADRGRARALLGDGAVGLLGAPAKAEAFRMKLDPEGREPSPPNAERVAGYLVAGPARPVSADASKKVAALLVDDATYDFSPRKACRVDGLFGFRFTKEQSSVEVAFELRGERVYVAIADAPGKGRVFSARFSPARAQVFDALRAAFDGDRDLPAK